MTPNVVTKGCFFFI